MCYGAIEILLLLLLLFTKEDIAYKLRGSPAWKHTITRDIQATVGVQHGNTHSHKRIYTGSVGDNIHIGQDLVLTLGGQVEDNYT